MGLWAKLHTDIIGDEKLMRAARKGARQLVLLPWLIAFAKKADDQGRLSVNGEPADPIDMASGFPGVTEKQVSQCISELENLGILVRDGEFLRFGAWEKRSGHDRKKPSDSPERVKERVNRHRQRSQVVEPQQPPSIVTPGVTPPVTPLKRALQRPLDVDVDVDRDKEQRGVTRVTAAAPNVPGSAAVAPAPLNGNSQSNGTGPGQPTSPPLPDLPPEVVQFGRTFYGSSSQTVKADVFTQLRAILGDGTRYKGERIRATPERLARRCLEVIQVHERSPLREPAKAMAVLLAKLSDVGNAQDSPTEAAARQAEIDYGDDTADINAWLLGHPTEAQEIRDKMLRLFPTPAEIVARTNCIAGEVRKRMGAEVSANG